MCTSYQSALQAANLGITMKPSDLHTVWSPIGPLFSLCPLALKTCKTQSEW